MELAGISALEKLLPLSTKHDATQYEQAGKLAVPEVDKATLK